ncbi:hypothetical protein LX81_02518 [Palleronia aestuarii]|uniref:Histidine kinase n=1 Tax=Palleronia aestuarii TaxID=568105 RepID=A0A2W7N4E5_9RHOB|nr:DUF6446 family protein [Palleronia aestuarii]PZX15215.1 hypothetical protein LX81_02518 [Palleronia aestuarii]
MIGKLIAIFLVVLGLLTAGSVYYLQVYYFYEEPEMSAEDVRLTPLGRDEPVAIPATKIEAIDAESSPIRFRACFRTDLTPDAARETYRPYEDAEPLNAPGWFDCFDAAAIGSALLDGRATAFLGERNYAYGVDRIVALTEDGHGYVWHQLNNCGDVDYTGTPTTEACPPREDVQ